MKKNLLIASLLVTGLLASCSKETGEVPPQEQQELKFSVATDIAETRATPVLGEAFPTTVGTAPAPVDRNTFAIYAYNKIGTNYLAAKVLDGVTATVSGNPYTVALAGSPYYKPLDSEGHAIYCISPASLKTSATVTSVASPSPTMAITHTVPTDFAAQPDVLYAQIAPNAAAFPQNIGLLFKHMLTRVTFQCKLTGTTNATSVTIKSLALNNVVGTGTLTLDSGAENWSNNTATTSSFSVTLGANAKELVGGTIDEVDTPNSGTGGYTNVFADGVTNNSFLMIPANTATLNAGSLGVVVTIVANGISQDYPFNIADLGGKNWSGTSTPAPWVRGNNVNYRLELNMSKLIPELTISSVTVEKWGNPEHVDIPLNP